MHQIYIYIYIYRYHRHPGQGHMQWKQELCHDSKQRRGLENTKDIQQEI